MHYPRLLVLLSLVFFAILSTQSAQASCLISITVTNDTSGDIDILPRLSKSKRKGGTWRRLTKGGWLHDEPSNNLRLSPGESITDDYLATSNCTRNRRFYLRAVCVTTDNVYGGAIKVYRPSRSGWTSSQTVSASMDFVAEEFDCT